MPETNLQILQILLSVAAGLLALLLALGWRISRRLARIERKLIGKVHRDDLEASPSQAETQAGGAFEKFLDENPTLRLLPKSEQFSAYRKWRQAKGLNWSANM